MATWPSIDHGILSPSGRVSGRARKAAMQRERVRLGWDQLFADLVPGLPAQPSERESLLRQAAELRELAKRGMKPRAYLKAAIALEARAASAA